MPTPNKSRRTLQDFVDTRRVRSGPHLPPGRAYLRASQDKSRAQAPPESAFPRKLSAFLRNQVGGWLFSYLKFRLGPRHSFLTYAPGDNGIYRLAGDSYFKGGDAGGDEIRMAVAGDWATGTDESDRIARRMQSFQPHFTVHLGDVYYVGDQEEVEANYLGGAGGQSVKWPVGSVGAFALNGNHEMYANGHAYFDSLLPAMGVRAEAGAPPGKQKASFFCLRNDYWDVIGIDTGYNSVGLPFLELVPWFAPSCKLHDDLLGWLRSTVKPGESQRGLVLLGHHQYYSAFESIYPKPAQQLAEFINRPVLWFWGHEHRLAVYGKARIGGIEAFGRCVGHAGMPVDIGAAPKTSEYPLVIYDDRQYAVLDGTPVGFNGLTNLTFRGDSLAVEHRDINNQLLLREEWQTRNGILSGIRIERGLQDPKLVEMRDLTVAIGGSQARAAG
jgi:calcineurin-like phosphoesterase family protein